MIKKQETMILREYTGIYDLVVPRDNMCKHTSSYDKHLVLKGILPNIQELSNVA